MRRLLKILTSRLMLVVPLVILQFGLFAAFLYRMAIFTELVPFFSLISILISIWIINQAVEPAYKIGWILVVMGAPIIGIPLYLLAGNRHVPKKLNDGTIHANQEMMGLLKNDEVVVKEGKKADQELQNIQRLIQLNVDGILISSIAITKDHKELLKKAGIQWLF